MALEEASATLAQIEQSKQTVEGLLKQIRDFMEGNESASPEDVIKVHRVSKII